MNTFKIYSLSILQTYTTVLLTIVTTLYIMSQDLLILLLEVYTFWPPSPISPTLLQVFLFSCFFVYLTLLSVQQLSNGRGLVVPLAVVQAQGLAQFLKEECVLDPAPLCLLHFNQSPSPTAVSL